MTRPWLAVLGALAVAVAAASCGGSGGRGDGGPSDDGARDGTGTGPNVVVIMTDDQTAESLRVMTRTQQLLVDQGTTFTNGIATFPLCCPARAQFLTGQYSHNNGVRDNTLPDGGYPALDDDETLPVWLQEAGYATSHVGKYLNAYTRDAGPDAPPGWDRWFSLVDPTATDYFDYDINDNGRFLRRGTADDDYQTDVLADRAVDEVHRMAAGDQPFLLHFWPTAPHSGTGPGALPFSPAPAPRHLEQFADEPLLDSPAMRETDVSDKPDYVAGVEQAFALGVVEYNLANGTDLTLDQLATESYRRYLESLLAVDEAVGRIVEALDEEGVLDDTVIVFLSDNGWSFGEHGIPFAKVLPYENVLRVPFVVRGGGFAAGATVDEQVGIIDLPATILALAGVAPSLTQDGRPLPGREGDGVEPVDALPERALLLESPPRGSGRIPHYDGVRAPRYTYVRYETGEIELYDRQADPDQLTNIATDPAHTDLVATLEQLMAGLMGCVGTGCQAPAPPGT